MDGLAAHKITIQKLNIYNDNLIIHFLLAHSPDQTQPLDLCVFAVAKRFMSNYRYNSDLTRQTNQITRIHNSLIQAATPSNFRASFKSIGIVSQIKFTNKNSVQIFAKFNLRTCSRIRNYTINYIEQLVQYNIPLSPNQLYFYQQKNAKITKKTQSMTVLAFLTTQKKISNYLKGNFL